MKSCLRFICLLITITLLQSCRKEISSPPQNPVIGSWILSDASESDGYTWQPFTTGFENAVFNFYSNGSVQYNDGHIIMVGNWYLQTSANGYYDAYGNFYTNSHQTFEVHTADVYSNNTLDLYFDDINFINNNQFVATYYDGSFIQRYSFSRY